MLPAQVAQSSDKNVSTWYGAIPADLVQQARQWAFDVVARLADPAVVPTYVVRAAEQAVHPMPWSYPSFSHGHGGLAVLYANASAAATDETERATLLEVAMAYIREAFDGTQIEPLDETSIFAGTSGLALCVDECCREEPRLGASLGRLHDQLAAQAQELDLPRAEGEVKDSYYDMISGASGPLTYLASIPDPSDAVRAATDRLIDYLIWLSEPPDSPRLASRWVITPDYISPLDRSKEHYPDGFVNSGVAHGVPGALGALAGAWHAGYRRPGQHAAIERMTAWLLSVRSTDEHGTVWPGDIPLTEDGVEQIGRPCIDQLAWCYGTAGVSNALLSAADALGDDTARAAAVEAFEAVLDRMAERHVLTPTLCHGLSGVLNICMELAARTDSARIRAAVPRLLRQLIDFGDRFAPLVFVDQEEENNFVDSPSLLTGAAGVALTLFGAVSPTRPTWLRAFLLR